MFLRREKEKLFLLYKMASCPWLHRRGEKYERINRMREDRTRDAATWWLVWAPVSSLSYVGHLRSWCWGNDLGSVQCSSIAPSCLTLQFHGLQHARLPCPSPIPGAYSDSCPSSWWCHPTISSSVVPFSCLQSSPALGSFQTRQLFPSGDQSIGVSASASVLPMNIQDWFPLGLTWVQGLGCDGLFGRWPQKS